MSRYAIVENETVTNVALWDGEMEWKPNGQVIQLPEDSSVGPGWGYVNGEWIEPPSPEPMT